MRILIAAVLVLSCSLCLAEDFPKNTDEIKSLTAEQAADLIMVVTHVREHDILFLNGLTSIDKDVAQELVKREGERLVLHGLTSIDKDVAQELAEFEGDYLFLDGLTSIDKDVAEELAKFEGFTLSLDGLTSIDKDVAQEFAKREGEKWLHLDGLTSIDEVSLAYLKSNRRILLPMVFRLKKD